ncbi:hypothetical protein KSS87_019866 [Heliosperma pusillum]|nr:hypothetical protein KSS87_000871 [Heliosperma pusillum]KAH9624217.1 hypothetical protein KSS87_019866 [Heliosperma pusillum]
MASISFYMFFCVAAFFNRLHFSIGSDDETDRVALLKIKAEVTDSLGVMRSWNDTLHFCKWDRVKCGRRHHRVTILELSSSNLLGTISPFVGNLSFLRVLDLQNNSFTGIIPSTIGRLQQLQSLLLNENIIGGQIPSNISGCSRLTVLEAGNNKLVGVIPSELASLSYLNILSLVGNNYTGKVPSFFGNLTSLSQLYLSGNNFDGMIPDSLGKLRHLTRLTLSSNNLSGIVPPSIFNLSFMTVLDLGQNELEGYLSPYLGNTLPQLQFLSVYGNRLTGLIPVSMSNSSNLQTLQLDGNSLQGQIPSLQKLEKIVKLNLAHNFLGNGLNTDLDFVSSLANATMLQEFDISGNNFKGNFPKVICNFSMMLYLQLETNKIDGQLPSCIGNLANLQVFSVKGNQIGNVIPEGLGKLRSLSRLDLSGNKFSGSIPFSMGNLSQLTILYLSGNNLEGNIPFTLGNCGKLQDLNLSVNNLSGRIPIQLLSLSSLSITLNLHQNRLSGSLPEEIGQLTNLGTLDLGENMFSGVIPSTLGNCIGLERLYLEGNDFQGAISDSLQTLKGLTVLDFSRNNFSGNIPNFLASLQLQMLNLSYNNFQGEVPTGDVFRNATAVSILGNKKLCGGIPEFKLRKCDLNMAQVKNSSHRTSLILSILFAFVGVALVVGLVLFYKGRKTKPRASGGLVNFLQVSYQSLQKATNGFSAENLIGCGAFGTVYKGILDPGSETLVAIKVFNLEIHGGFKSFVAECEVLRNIKHRNLVKVITACSGVDYQGKHFKALVYEYMVNKSLDDWLHPISELDDTNNSMGKLNYLQRFDIAVDVAFALDYLHHQSGVSIIHCDLKPSNVLLDDEMVAHVGDFGLARLLSKDAISSYANQSSSVGVRGTIGYTPPEYGLGSKVSTQGDVYSFGILLLEMFTGRRPTDGKWNKGKSLHSIVKAALSKQVTEVLDPLLLEDIVREETGSGLIMKAVTSTLSIALLCSADLPRERLNMTDVATRLSSIRNSLREALSCRGKITSWGSGESFF